MQTDIIPDDPAVAAKIVDPLIAITRAADRIGTIEDIADIVLLLASDRSRWITGQHISASGGITGV